MKAQYYIRFKGNGNDVDLNSLVAVCRAFSLLLNSAASQILVSGDFRNSETERLQPDEKQPVILSMQQTKKGSCLIPILADVANQIDVGQFKDAVNCVLSEASRIFNDEFWRTALAGVVSGAVVEKEKALFKRKSEEKASPSKSALSVSCECNPDASLASIERNEIESLRANEDFYQAMLNLFAALDSDSLNSEFSIEDEDHNEVLRATRSQQDVFESPLANTLDFSNQIMKVKFKGWREAGEGSRDVDSLEGLVLDEPRTLKVNDETVQALQAKGIAQGSSFEAVVSGKRMVNKETGKVYYRGLKVERLLD